MITPDQQFHFVPEDGFDKQALSWTEASVERRFFWKVPDSLPYFEGHFPNQPLLPAFAIFDANLLLLKALLPPNWSVQKIKSAKFLAPVQPGCELSICVKTLAPAEAHSQIRNLEIVWKSKGEEKALTQFNLVAAEGLATTASAASS